MTVFEIFDVEKTGSKSVFSNYLDNGTCGDGTCNGVFLRRENPDPMSTDLICLSLLEFEIFPKNENLGLKKKKKKKKKAKIGWRHWKEESISYNMYQFGDH